MDRMAEPDDDKTRLLVPGQVISAATAHGNVLAPGFRLFEYEIQRVIGEGGFGIVYLARDSQLHRIVAIKEYMPSALASRQSDMSVAVKSERYAETFDAGLKSFINEARLLAQFDEAALLKVHRFWEANGTAYMVMPYYNGPTLKQWLDKQAAPPSEAWLRQMVAPLIDALEVLHGQNIFHRDIAPDNILLLDTGLPLLLDFGAARRIIGDLTQALTVVLKPGYAPMEQYAEVASMRQGPWTDVYALAATLYFAAAGRAPPPSVGRMMNDDLKAASKILAGRYSAQFLKAIDQGLALRPADRPQSMAQFRTLLLGTDARVPPPRGVPLDFGNLVKEPPPPVYNARRPAAVKPANKSFPIVTVVGLAIILALAGAIYQWKSQQTVAAAGRVADSPTQVQPLPAPSPPSPSAALPPETAAATPLPVTRSPTGDAAAVQRASEKPPSLPDTRVDAQGNRSPTAVAPPAKAVLNSARALADALFAGASHEIQVSATASMKTLVIDKDKLDFKVESNQSGYLYVFFANSDNTLSMVFPNSKERENRIQANTEIRIPRSPRIFFRVEDPPGRNWLVFMVSPFPRDFAPGLFRDGEFFDVDLKVAAAGSAANGSGFLAGMPRCPTPTPADCDGRYGADSVEIIGIHP